MRVIIILFSLLPYLATAAPPTKDTLKTRQLGIFFALSGQALDISALNNQLLAANRNQLEQGLFGVSLGVTFGQRINSSYGTAKVTLWDGFEQRPQEGTQTDLTAWELSYRSIFDVLQSANWLIYPYLDIGFQVPQLTISTIVDNRTFSQSLGSTDGFEVVRQKYRLDRVLWLGELGLGIERRSSFIAVHK